MATDNEILAAIKNGGRAYYASELSTRLPGLPNQGEILRALKRMRYSGLITKDASGRFCLPKTPAAPIFPATVDVPLPAAGRKKSVRITHIQGADIIGKLREAYDADVGYYKDGHSDNSIAAGMSFPCTPAGVAYLRLELFGPYKRGPAVVAHDCAALVERVRKLEGFLMQHLDFVP